MSTENKNTSLHLQIYGWTNLKSSPWKFALILRMLSACQASTVKYSSPVVFVLLMEEGTTLYSQITVAATSVNNDDYD